MTIGEELRAIIQSALKDAGAPECNFTVEPTDLVHGDYATNVALVAGKVLKKNPRDLAEEIKSILLRLSGDTIKDVAVAGPGFVNIVLSDHALQKVLKEPTGRNDSLKGRKYVVEYTDPNPLKEFHIGHLMSNTVGEALSRLIEVSGAETKRACYQGDVGIHVACTVWGKQKDPSLSWGKAYAFGATTYKNGTDEEKKEIVALNKVVYMRSDELVNALYDEGRKDSLDAFEVLYKKLGTKFDFYFFESKTGPFGKELVEKHTGTIFEKSEGAVVYKGDETKGLHTRVFINKEGLPTYEAKELGLAQIKYDTYPYDHSVVITANEVNEYFRVLLDAMSKVFPELAKKTEHIGHGIMKLPTGKMSSRTGDVVTAESMIADVKAKVLERMTESPVPKADRERVAEEVAIGSIKYSILRQAPGKDIIFDIETATSFEGDSGAYLAYTHARLSSLLEKGKEFVRPDVPVPSSDLARLLVRFADVVLRAQKDRAPQYIATYLIEITHAFNRFYGETLIIDPKDIDATSGRLRLVSSAKATLKCGLWMLGISVPEMM